MHRGTISHHKERKVEIPILLIFIKRFRKHGLMVALNRSTIPSDCGRRDLVLDLSISMILHISALKLGFKVPPVVSVELPRYSKS